MFICLWQIKVFNKPMQIVLNRNLRPLRWAFFPHYGSCPSVCPFVPYGLLTHKAYETKIGVNVPRSRSIRCATLQRQRSKNKVIGRQQLSPENDAYISRKIQLADRALAGLLTRVGRLQWSLHTRFSATRRMAAYMAARNVCFLHHTRRFFLWQRTNSLLPLPSLSPFSSLPSLPVLLEVGPIKPS